MDKQKLYFKLNHVDAMVPKKGTKHSAGYDLFCIENQVVLPHKFIKLDTGVSVCIPNGYFGKIEARSSMGVKGLSVLAGVIDSDYRGSIAVILLNNSEEAYHIKKHDRVAQMVIHKILENEDIIVSEDLDYTERQENGFGHTGK